MANAQIAFTPCPFSEQPFTECAAKEITGASIPKITRYCMGDYSLCPVYKKKYERQLRGKFLNFIPEEKTHKDRRVV